MTSPTIIETPGTLDTAAAAFMQAFKQGQQLAMQRRELDIAQQRAQSDIALQGAEAGEAKARTAELQRQYDTALRQHDAATTANDLFSGLAARGALDDPAQVTQQLASIKDPDVHQAFGQFYQDYLNNKQATATTAHLNAQARAMGQQADFDAKIQPIVDQLIADPTAPLPTNPTARQAVAMARTGVLGMVEERLRLENQNRSESATQRQVLLSIYNRAHQNYAAAQRNYDENVRQYNGQVANARALRMPTDSIPKPQPPADLGTFLDQEATAAGTDTATVNGAVRDILSNFQRSRKNPAQRLDAPAGSGTAALFSESTYKGADHVTRQQMWEAASAVAQGGSLGAAGTDEQRDWIIRAARLLKRYANK